MNPMPASARRQVDRIAEDLEQKARVCRNLAQYTDAHDPAEAQALRACAQALQAAIPAIRTAGYKAAEQAQA